MAEIKNIIVPGSASLPMVVDFFYNGEGKNPVIIYAHGFNGFKDWGNFDIIARQAINQKFTFVKFNFSHNGTSSFHPEEFVDLEAFGNNNFSLALADLEKIIDWVSSPLNDYRQHIDEDNISLVGHSMGGGLAILAAAQDKRVKKLVTWASIAVAKTPWGSWAEEKIQEWKEKGVAFYKNSRTGQDMPLYFQLYEDYQQNAAGLDIIAAVKKLKIPFLICHGTADPAVSIDKAYELQKAQPSAKIFIVDSDHVFGRQHPWDHKDLPKPMQEVLSKTLDFFTNAEG
ncbi:MAG: alpha/beta fold hydrolase [Ferruginibacter sp.]